MSAGAGFGFSSHRPAGGSPRPPLHTPAQMFYKRARVEFHPVGVVGAIVPWNYPFHNILNPLTAAVFAGNGIVIKARGGGWGCGSLKCGALRFGCATQSTCPQGLRPSGPLPCMRVCPFSSGPVL